MILNDILSQKRKDIEELKRRFPLARLQSVVEHKPPAEHRSFFKAISPNKGIHIICELKKASPSEGVLREDFQPLRLASQLEYAGACAISVLTEPHYFKGRPSYLKTVRQVTKIPLLRKDFILESYQLYETCVLEADAFLLIAAILTDQELHHLIKLGTSLGMDALVEIHTEEDLKKAVQSGAKIIGINNRDLKTLSTDADRAKKLIPHIPKGIPIIVESGIYNSDQILEYTSLGVHSFLVGTHLMKAPDVVEAVQSLLRTNAKWK